MIKFGILLLLMCLTGLLVNAQTVIKGRVYEDKTRVTLSDVQVRDITNKQTVLTDKDGRYALKAKVGDLLLFTSFAYENDTLVVTNLRDREVFLLPKGNELKGVDISGNAVAAPTSFKPAVAPKLAPGVKYQTDKDGNAKGGVAMGISLFDKEQKKKEQQAKREADDKVREKIDVAFTPKNIALYVPLKGQELNDYISLYRPEVEVYSSKSFNLATYLNATYKEFMKLPPEKRHLVKLNN